NVLQSQGSDASFEGSGDPCVSRDTLGHWFARQLLEGGVQHGQQRDRGCAEVAWRATLVAFHHGQPVLVIGEVARKRRGAIFTRGSRPRSDGDNCQAWRRTNSFLRGSERHIYAPGVGVELLAANRAHAVHYYERVSFAGEATQRFYVLPNAGGRI